MEVENLGLIALQESLLHTWRGISAYFLLINTLVEFSGKLNILNIFRKKLKLASVQEKTTDGISQARGFLLGEKNKLQDKEGLLLL